MFLSKNNIRIGLEIIGVIILIVLLVTMLRGCNPRIDNTTYKDVISEMDKRFEIYKEQISKLEKDKQDLQDRIEQHERTDSALNVRAKQTIIKYEQIPMAVYSLSKDSLRSAVYNFR